MPILGSLWRLRHVDGPITRDVRRALVGTLFSSPSSLAAGAVAAAIISAMIGAESNDPLMIYLACAISVVGAARVAASATYREQRTRNPDSREGGWELIYEAGAWIFAALLGLMTYLTITREADAKLHLLAAATTTGYAAGISARNAGRPVIAIGQLTLAALPLTLALVQMRGVAIWALAIANILFIVAMIEISLATYQVILAAMHSVRDQSLLAKRFERLAQVDNLTGLGNRIALGKALDTLLAADVEDQRAILLWIDLDRFKEVNDTLGHPVGDQLLRKVSARLQSVMREGDCLARFGGDEFVLLAIGVAASETGAFAEQIVNLFRTPVVVDGATLHVTASVGVVALPQPGCGAETLLKYADMALYHAKSTGRNAYREFEPDMQQQLIAIRETEEGLRLAIQRGELELLYQPIIDLGSSSIQCCEALIRWNHPTRGVVSPADFIPLAERTGLIADVTAWVLAESCRAASTWPDHIRVAVNITPSLLKRPELLQWVMTALLESGLATKRLELEITESVFMGEEDQSNAMLRELQRIGLRLALDDFGTGYSSLAYLHKYRFDKIKIDGGFIRQVGESRAAEAIVNAVISLARTLEIETVAEGVETLRQLDHVRELGCTGVQGFLFSRALSSSAIAEVLQQPDWVARQLDRETRPPLGIAHLS